MSLIYGTNFTASDMNKLLEKNDLEQGGIRAWRKLFGNASLGYNAQSGAMLTDYTDVISQAYKSNLAQRNAMASAGFTGGATKELLGMTQQDLHNTYQNYMSNYRENLSKLNENYASERSEIQTGLAERAQNYADYLSAAVDYFYNHLAGSTDDGVDYFSDMGMNWMWENTPKKSLASREQLMNMLFDENGAITKEGTQFFDAIYNAQPQGYVRNDKEGSPAMSFDAWLSGENPELREWAASVDNFNYNFLGTNAGTAKVLLGLESTDQKYHRSEYYTKEEADKILTQEARSHDLQTLPSLETLRTAVDDYLEAIGVRKKSDSAENYSEATISKRKDEVVNAKYSFENEIVHAFEELIPKDIPQDLGPEKIAEFERLKEEYDIQLAKFRGSTFEELFGRKNGWAKHKNSLNTIYHEIYKLLNSPYVYTGKTSGY